MSKITRKRKTEPAPAEDVEVMAPKNKFRAYDAAMQAEEAKLSEILFGGTSTFLESLQEAAKETKATTTAIDSGVGETDSDDSDKCRKPAWVDEDDDGIDVGNALEAQGRRLPNGGINARSNQYTELLKQKFTSIVGTPKWADLNAKHQEDEDSDEEVLKTAGVVKSSKSASTTLKSGTIEVKKVNNLNQEAYSEGPMINSIEFHPTSSVSLIAGQSGVATIYAVDGKRNNKLHSLQFKNFPILCAKFSRDGNEAFLGSRQSHMFCYDLMAAKAIKIPLPTGLTQMKKFVMSPDGKWITVAGKWGEVHVLSALTKENLFMFKQDDDCTALCYNHDGSLLYGHSDTGVVTVWDVNTRRMMHKFEDEGCLQGTSLHLSPSNQFLATGSSQGVVNVYDTDLTLKQKTPTPRKSIMNLTTPIRDVKFNSTSECLAFFSSEVENAMRLFHLRSQTVFSNFPNFQTKLGNVNVVNYSPMSGYLAIGNTRSTVTLFRLKHFSSY